MMVSQMGANLVDQLADVVVDSAAFSTHHVEVVVGMCDLPPGGTVDAELRLSNEVEVLEQGE